MPATDIAQLEQPRLYRTAFLLLSSGAFLVASVFPARASAFIASDIGVDSTPVVFVRERRAVWAIISIGRPFTKGLVFNFLDNLATCDAASADQSAVASNLRISASRDQPVQ